jgi:hypothetical protein
MVIFGLMLFSARFPTPRLTGAPASEFSAERAVAVLDELLAEGVPHPIGSAENRRVRTRIIARLEALGLVVEEQHAIGCHARLSRCGFVENVMTRIPGSEPGPAVLLMAHYDSVPMAPGAGDDGAGVAAMLEIARILTAEAPRRNPVVLLFTDGEEVGLLGAEAFFGKHPWAQEVGVVLNVEGSGSEGESLLLRTGPDSGWVVDAFRRSVNYPSAASVADEVFRRMPNDTDFSVAQRAGLPGIDFAFAGERNHYHSPLDTVENLSLVTLQHHGENLLPLAQELASMKLVGQPSGDRLFHSLAQVGTISWKRESNLPLTVLALILLATAGVMAVRSGATTAGRVVIGTLVSLAIFVAVVLANLGVFKLLSMLNGTVVAWPAQEWPFRLCLAATTLIGTLLVAGPMGRFLDFWSSLLGAWLFYFLLAGSVVLLTPIAANLLLIPVLASSALILAMVLWRGLRHREGILAIATLAVATPMTLPLVLAFEQTQGYRLIIATFPFLALYAVSLHPLLRSVNARVRKPLLASGVALGLGMALAVSLPLYSEWRPQPLNIIFVEEQDQDSAHWILSSPGPIPGSMAKVLEFQLPDKPLIPWSRDTSAPAAEAPPSGVRAPAFTVQEISEVDGGRRLRLHLASRRGAGNIQVLIPESASLQSATVMGQNMQVQKSPGTWIRLSVEGTPREGFDLEVVIESGNREGWIVLDWISELPPAAEALKEARSPLAAPVHRGDQAIAYTWINF